MWFEFHPMTMSQPMMVNMDLVRAFGPMPAGGKGHAYIHQVDGTMLEVEDHYSDIISAIRDEIVHPEFKYRGKPAKTARGIPA